jgi:hypothetical protein
LKRRQGHFAVRRAHARPLNGDLAPAEHDFAADVPARLAGRSGSCAYRGPQTAVRSSSSIAVKTLRPDRIASSNSSVRVSTSRSTKGR